MSVRELTLRPLRDGAPLRTLWHSVASLHPIEQIAWLATVATPVALLLDYRLGISLWAVPHTYPRLYYGGYTAPGNFGVAQAVWIGAALLALAIRGARRGFASLTTISLFLLLLVIVFATFLLDGFDRWAAFAFLCVLVPLIAMAAVLTHPDVRPEVLKRLIAFVLVMTALVIVATVAWNAYETLRGAAGGAGHTLSDRFDLFLFGVAGPPETGAVLAGLVMLIPASGLRRLYMVGLAGCLIGGLLLSQTRGALIALVVGAAVLALLSGRLRWAVLGAAFGVGCVFLILSKRSLTSLNDASNIVRRGDLTTHLDFFFSRPLLGYGLSDAATNKVAVADNAILSVAIAGGVIGALLWLVAWCGPVVAGLGRRNQTLFASCAAATVAAFLVGWGTTGNEVLLENPPTNLIALVLAAAAGLCAYRTDPRVWRTSQGKLAAAFLVGSLVVVVAPLALARELGRPSTFGAGRHVVQMSLGNAVENPGAETGLGDWSTSGGESGIAPLLGRMQGAAVISSGRWAFLVSATNISPGPRDEVAYTSGAFRLQPRQTYRLSAYVSGVATSKQPLLLGLRLTDGSLSQAFLRGRGATKTKSGNGTLLQAVLSTRRRIGPVQVAIWRKALPSGETAYFAFDDVRLCTVDSPRC